MAKKIGPKFPAELEAAGLLGLPFSWTADGEILFGEDMSAEHVAAVRAVYASHDPSAPSLSQLSALVQSHLDATAARMGYDNIFTAVTYAEEPAVPRFQQEGRALRAWRSAVWARCYQVLGEVEAGQRAAPSAAELLALLPEISA